jgi:hypothetical protein
VVPRKIAHQTEQTLQAAGRNGDELFVLWSGHQDGPTFTIRSGHVPLQTAYKTGDGLSVRVEGEELHKLNSWLFERQEILAVQIHCHPDDAYHSETDNRFPIVTTIGGTSVVIPEFCRHGLFVPGTAIYRLSEDGWTLSESKAIEIFVVV